MEFRFILKDLLDENNLTINEFANKMKIKNSSIVYGWLKGDYIPKLDKLNEIANLFNCSIDYLLGRTENIDIVSPKSIKPLCENLTKILADKK